MLYSPDPYPLLNVDDLEFDTFIDLVDSSVCKYQSGTSVESSFIACMLSY